MRGPSVQGQGSGILEISSVLAKTGSPVWPEELINQRWLKLCWNPPEIGYFILKYLEHERKIKFQKGQCGRNMKDKLKQEETRDRGRDKGCMNLNGSISVVPSELGLCHL